MVRNWSYAGLDEIFFFWFNTFYIDTSTHNTYINTVWSFCVVLTVDGTAKTIFIVLLSEKT